MMRIDGSSWRRDLVTIRGGNESRQRDLATILRDKKSCQRGPAAILVGIAWCQRDLDTSRRASGCGRRRGPASPYDHSIIFTGLYPP